MSLLGHLAWKINITITITNKQGLQNSPRGRLVSLHLNLGGLFSYHGQWNMPMSSEAHEIKHAHLHTCKEGRLYVMERPVSFQTAEGGASSQSSALWMLQSDGSISDDRGGGLRPEWSGRGGRHATGHLGGGERSKGMNHTLYLCNLQKLICCLVLGTRVTELI